MNHQLEKDWVSSSGAKRSKEALPWWMLPWEALREVAKRFAKGQAKFGTNNWKKGIGSGDETYVQQIVNHYEDHKISFLLNVGEWKSDEEGETPLDHLGGMAWGILCLIYYCIYDKELVMKAFHQGPRK